MLDAVTTRAMSIPFIRKFFAAEIALEDLNKDYEKAKELLQARRDAPFVSRTDFFV